MTSLRERAAEMAGSTDTLPVLNGTPAESPQDIPELPDIDVPEPGPDGPEKVPAVVAWSRVMGEVRAIKKENEFSGGRAGTFKFRGVDLALNAFGPVCRRHGVLVIPFRVESAYRDVKTSSGSNMRECVCTVTYHIYGPTGDFIEAQAAGEALDTGGRSTPKAQSVALRTLLLGAGLVPTEDGDPDAQNIERGEAAVRMPQDYRDEAVDPDTSRNRLLQIHHEVKQHRLVNALVINEDGQEEHLGALIVRVGRERFEAKQ